MAKENVLSVRLGLHTGEIEVTDDGRCMGDTLNRCARLRDLACGGQTLISRPISDLVADRLPDAVTLADMGTHKLRDLARPEHLYQVGHPDLPSQFPPLASLATNHNLPIPLTSFVGRAAELAELLQLLTETRVLTLTRCGGMWQDAAGATPGRRHDRAVR